MKRRLGDLAWTLGPCALFLGFLYLVELSERSKVAEIISVALLYLGIVAVALVGLALLGFILIWNVAMIPLLFKGLWSLVSGNGRYRFVGAWKVVDTKPWLSDSSQEPE